MWSDREAVEIFHLLFLRAFGARVDKALYCLKGGCNLRFFFKSIRYSEDMDLDVKTMAVGTLRNNVNRLLESPSFVQLMRASGMELSDVAQPKQTATTQRWKLTLRITESGVRIPTKIEFSRRAFDDDKALQPVDADIVRAYRLYPVIVQHYTVDAAFAQKVVALAMRGQVQARDVFDLKLLLDAGAGEKRLPAPAATHLGAAIDHAMGIGYDEFAGQVLAYLAPEFQEYYGSRRAWSDLQDQVVGGLQAITS